MAWITRILIGCVALYVALVAVMFFGQRRLQYFPNAEIRLPSDLGLNDFDRVVLKTKDNVTLLAWYHPSPVGRPTILYFHGNAGGISDRAEKLKYFAQQGFGFLALSYRGFEGSAGSPSEAGFKIDADTAYAWLREHNISEYQIMLLGESLGTGVAVQLSAHAQAAAMALEAPYANAVDVGAASYWFLPVRLLMRDQFRSMDSICMFSGPLLIIHGTEDRVIPFTQGRKLFAAANQPKQFIPVEGAGHELIFAAHVWAKEVEFFNSVAEQ